LGDLGKDSRRPKPRLITATEAMRHLASIQAGHMHGHRDVVFEKN
jgi:hypothetical protein